MAVNLANVNITIQQFQAISAGKWNAGEVTLTSDHSLGKVNYHVHAKGLNTTPLSHHIILAVKSAFVRALQQNGVAGDEIARVRRELGLAPEGAVDTALASRSIVPLTRQQVRQILDRNAQTINHANNGRPIIRTEAELHARYDQETRGNIVRTRNQVNASLVRNRALMPDKRIVDIQNVIAGNIHYTTAAGRERLITAALRQKACILEGSHGNPSHHPDATMGFTIPETGQTLTLSLGMSEADYVKKLDDMLAVLRGDRHPSDAVLAVRNEFRTLAAKGPEHARAFVASLANDPQGAFKARTIAVSLLFDGGIDDYETLSLVNRVSDFAAIALVSHLVNHRDPNLRGDALRQSPAVAVLAQQVEEQEIPADRKTYIPALSPREANFAAYAALTASGRELSHEMKTMADEVVAEFRERYGVEAVPEGVRFGALVSAQVFSEALGLANDVRLPIAEVKANVLAGAAADVAKRVIQNVVRPLLLAAGGIPAMAPAVSSDLFVRLPALKNLLVAAQSPEEVAQIVEDFRADIEAGVRRQVAVDHCRDQAKTWYREEIAAALGVPVSTLEGRVLCVTRLSAKSNELGTEICAGRNPADSGEEIEQAFRELALRHAGERIALLRQADALEMQPSTRDVLKEQILAFDKVTGFDLASLRDHAANVPVKPLLDALAAGAPANEIFEKMGAVGHAARQEAGVALAGQHLGADESAAATTLLVTLALDKEPGLLEMVRSFFLKPDIIPVELGALEGEAARAVAFQIFKPDEPAAESNAALADSIGRPNMPPLVAQAINLAFEDLGLGGLSQEEKAKLLAGAHGRSLVSQVRGAAQPVTPAALRAMARGAFIEDAAHASTKSILSQFARMNGFKLSDDSIEHAKGVLTRRAPSLLATLKTEIARAAAFGKDVHEAVDRIITAYYDVADTTLRAFHEIETVNAAAVDRAVREIAVRANLEEATVRAKLNTRGLVLEFSGALNVLRSIVRDELSDPATDITAYSVQDVAARANERVERFIARKTAFIAEIAAMELSDAAKGNLIVRTLEQQSYTNPAHVAFAREIAAAPEVQAALAVVRKAFTPQSVAIMTDAELFRSLEFFTTAVNKAMEHVIPEDQRAGMDIGDVEVIRQLVTFTMMDFCGAALTSALEALARDGRFETIRAAGSEITEEYNAQYLNAAAPMPPAPGAPAPEPDPVAAAAAERSLSNARAASNVLAVITDALADEWLPADVADAYHNEVQGVAERANAAMKRAPTLFARYSEGLDEAGRAELKSYVITLDFRDAALAATEAAINAKAMEIRLRGKGGTTATTGIVAEE